MPVDMPRHRREGGDDLDVVLIGKVRSAPGRELRDHRVAGANPL